jgi:hypothetical protein
MSGDWAPEDGSHCSTKNRLYRMNEHDTMTVIYNIPTSMEIPFPHARSTVKYHDTLCECNSNQTQTINSLGILQGKQVGDLNGIWKELQPIHLNFRSENKEC